MGEFSIGSNSLSGHLLFCHTNSGVSAVTNCLAQKHPCSSARCVLCWACLWCSLPSRVCTECRWASAVSLLLNVALSSGSVKLSPYQKPEVSVRGFRSRLLPSGSSASLLLVQLQEVGWTPCCMNFFLQLSCILPSWLFSPLFWSFLLVSLIPRWRSFSWGPERPWHGFNSRSSEALFPRAGASSLPQGHFSWSDCLCQ